MAWTAGADVSTGDLITAATWNLYLGATGSIEYLYDNSAVVLLTTRGDMLFRNATVPARLAKGTQYQVLRMGANDPEWEDHVKELWVPCTGTELGTFPHTLGVGPAVLLNADGEYALCYFKCPSDFSALLAANFIVNPAATQATANWDIFSQYGAVGEAYNADTESDVATTYNVTLNQLFAVDISGILSNLAADDYVGVGIKQAAAAHNIEAIGLYLTYTS